jgi:isopentenyl-diphosphate delta-isomerase
MKPVKVVLVDTLGQPIGTQEKLAAHELNQLHLAFSVMLYREVDGHIEVLLQQRAAGKYHSANHWANTCCSHPQPDEALAIAAKRRLVEELNLELTAELQHCGSFIYHAQLTDELSEHEFDHVLIAPFNAELPLPNPDEVQALQWMRLSELEHSLKIEPERYAVWLPYVVQHVTKALAQ